MAEAKQKEDGGKTAFLTQQLHEPYRIAHEPCGLKVEKPNFVIFMPDQLRFDALGCSGNKIVKTPNIDAFAGEGTRFTNCFVQATVCSQSRCSMFTGNYSHVSGHRSLENLIKPWEPNLFRALKEEGGYHVACLAPRGDTFAPTVTELSMDEYGWLATPEFMPSAPDQPPEGSQEEIWGRLFYRGRLESEDTVDYDEALIRSALQWLERPPKDKPWVLFLPLIWPHCPFNAPDPWFSMYDRAQMPQPSDYRQKTGYEPAYFQAIREQYGTDRATPEMWAEIVATYYGMISRLDQQFGRVVQKMKELGHWDRTITTFLTDHGESLGDAGLIEKWPSGLSDCLAHEPLIIGGGGLPQGVVYEEMAEMVDLLPTLLQFAAVDQTFPHCGKSMAKLLVSGGTTGQARRHAFTEGGFLLSEEPLLEQAPYPYDIKATLQHADTRLVGKAVACRDKRWTYIYRLYEEPELYDRWKDADELHNLAADDAHAQVRRDMEAVVLRWQVETADVLPFQRDPRFPDVRLEPVAEQWARRGAT